MFCKGVSVSGTDAILFHVGKPITTSVPTFAIRFHAGGEELEELYPSEEEDKSLVDEKCPDSSASEPTKTESSPMRDYLNKLGKRSSSIDAGINDTPNDPWRIFSEFKGKLTKTVEEKLSEIKSKSNEAESSPKFTKANSKDNSSISDSEEHSYSECSVPKSTGLSSTAEDIEMSSDDEGSLVETPINKIMLQTELRKRNEPSIQISYLKDQEEIIFKPKEEKTDDDIESGVEACEDTLVHHSQTVTYAPQGFIDFRSTSAVEKETSFKKHYVLFSAPLIIILLFIIPSFLSGFIIGAIIPSVCFYYFCIFINKISNFEISTEKDVKLHEYVVPPIKEYQPIMKFEVISTIFILNETKGYF